MNLYDQIVKLAYELYEKSGRIEGHDLDNWLKAERIVMSNYAGKETDEAPKKGTSRKSTKKASKKQ